MLPKNAGKKRLYIIMSSVTDIHIYVYREQRMVEQVYKSNR